MSFRTDRFSGSDRFLTGAGTGEVTGSHTPTPFRGWEPEPVVKTSPTGSRAKDCNER